MIQEDELIKRMEQGDATAMNDLIALYYPEILRYCLWHAPNQSLAEDAVQETFLKTIRFFDRYAHRGKFKAFLYQIAANTCIDMRRKKWASEVSLEGMQEAFVYIEKGFKEVHRDLEWCALINMLPEEAREIVILRFSQELSLREIAQVTGLPLRTVQSRLRAVLKRMKKDLEKGEQSRWKKI